MHFPVLGALEVGADGVLAELGPPEQRAQLRSCLRRVACR
jgi:hypothetical protein